MTRIMFINPNTSEEFTKRIESIVKNYALPTTTVAAANPKSGPKSIESIYDELLSCQGTLELAITEMDNFEPLVNHVKAACENLGREYAGALLRPYGWAFRELKRMGYPVDKVYEACREAGVQMIRSGSIPEEVLEGVSRNLVSRDEIVSAYNKQYE